MVEKPISAHKADAERLVAAHRRAAEGKLVFAGMFQLRVEPRYTKIRKLIQEGELGEIVRLSWIITDWYRTEAYYSSGGWRATWKGEGGGVLLNQCLHNLDTLQWLCGMPARVRGFCQLGRYHSIEVEDDVTGYLEFANGATGVFITSTGEAPGTNRLEIAGTRGRVVLEKDRLTFTRNEVSMTEFSRTSRVGFLKPEVWNVEIPIENAPAPHAALMQNFVDAILGGTPLIAPGADGINSVELANVMLYSSLTGQTVNLPLDAAAYERKLAELIAGSTAQKNVVEVSTEDFARSFNR
jgi:predicted dehydrogenase